MTDQWTSRHTNNSPAAWAKHHDKGRWNYTALEQYNRAQARLRIVTSASNLGIELTPIADAFDWHADVISTLLAVRKSPAGTFAPYRALEGRQHFDPAQQARFFWLQLPFSRRPRPVKRKIEGKSPEVRRSTPFSMSGVEVSRTIKQSEIEASKSIEQSSRPNTMAAGTLTGDRADSVALMQSSNQARGAQRSQPARSFADSQEIDSRPAETVSSTQTTQPKDGTFLHMVHFRHHRDSGPISGVSILARPRYRWMHSQKFGPEINLWHKGGLVIRAWMEPDNADLRMAMEEDVIICRLTECDDCRTSVDSLMLPFPGANGGQRDTGGLPFVHSDSCTTDVFTETLNFNPSMSASSLQVFHAGTETKDVTYNNEAGRLTVQSAVCISTDCPKCNAPPRTIEELVSEYQAARAASRPGPMEDMEKHGLSMVHRTSVYPFENAGPPPSRWACQTEDLLDDSSEYWQHGGPVLRVLVRVNGPDNIASDSGDGIRDVMLCQLGCCDLCGIDDMFSRKPYRLPFIHSIAYEEGVGDGEFNPSTSATRDEAIQSDIRQEVVDYLNYDNMMSRVMIAVPSAICVPETCSVCTPSIVEDPTRKRTGAPLEGSDPKRPNTGTGPGQQTGPLGPLEVRGSLRMVHWTNLEPNRPRGGTPANQPARRVRYADTFGQGAPGWDRGGMAVLAMLDRPGETARMCHLMVCDVSTCPECSGDKDDPSDWERPTGAPFVHARECNGPISPPIFNPPLNSYANERGDMDTKLSITPVIFDIEGVALSVQTRVCDPTVCSSCGPGPWSTVANTDALSDIRATRVPGSVPAALSESTRGNPTTAVGMVSVAIRNRVPAPAETGFALLKPGRTSDQDRSLCMVHYINLTANIDADQPSFTPARTKFKAEHKDVFSAPVQMWAMGGQVLNVSVDGTNFNGVAHSTADYHLMMCNKDHCAVCVQACEPPRVARTGRNYFQGLPFVHTGACTVAADGLTFRPHWSTVIPPEPDVASYANMVTYSEAGSRLKVRSWACVADACHRCALSAGISRIVSEEVVEDTRGMGASKPPASTNQGPTTDTSRTGSGTIPSSDRITRSQTKGTSSATPEAEVDRPVTGTRGNDPPRDTTISRPGLPATAGKKPPAKPSTKCSSTITANGARRPSNPLGAGLRMCHRNNLVFQPTRVWYGTAQDKVPFRATTTDLYYLAESNSVYKYGGQVHRITLPTGTFVDAMVCVRPHCNNCRKKKGEADFANSPTNGEPFVHRNQLTVVGGVQTFTPVGVPLVDDPTQTMQFQSVLVAFPQAFPQGSRTVPCHICVVGQCVECDDPAQSAVGKTAVMKKGGRGGRKGGGKKDDKGGKGVGGGKGPKTTNGGKGTTSVRYNLGG